MALRAGYYGVKRFLRDKLETIAGTYDETIKILFPRSEQAVLGAKNWLNIPKGTYTQFDVTIVVDDTGITLNGTCNATSGTKVNVSNLPVSIDAKVADYKGVDVTNNMSDDCYIWMSSPFSGGNINGKSWTVSTAAKVTGALSIKGGVTYTNFKIQPMIVLASDSDLSTYAPYAMTNKELTDSAADQKTAINAIITAATGAADFAAFKTAMGAITPVTRSLLLTKEDITEEVKEDVEPEKTVTKKRTTKKTEEV